MHPQNKVIFLENIDKRFAGVHALKGITFGIEPSKVHCLAGENGSGKSTMIKVMSGVYKPDKGSIHIDGKTFAHLTPMYAIDSGIHVIYQDFSLFSNLTVAENIAINYHLQNRNKIITKKQNIKIAKSRLEQINVGIDPHELVENLSVADKQIVAIARALLFENSKLIIMDEPTSALTHHEIQRLLDIILQLKQRGISILFVSHKLGELIEVCDVLSIFRNGEKVAEGPSTDFTERSISSYMIGRELAAHRHTASYSHTPLLEVKNIGHKNKFKNISFTLRKGEVLGITGLLGCGRTEIALSLFGVLPIEEGSILIQNKEVKLRSVEMARAQGIGYVPEDRLTEGLFLSQSILRNTIVSSFDTYSNVLGMVDFRSASNAVANKTAELKLNTTDLNMPVQNLSGGNQQRVVIAKWLCADTKILIFNGPSVGVDIGSRFEIHKKIKALAQDGMGIIVISDDIPELLETCHSIYLIHKGEIAQTFENNEAVEQKLIDAFNKIK